MTSTPHQGILPTPDPSALQIGIGGVEFAIFPSTVQPHL